ncbi:hypothetical protein AOQ84DRAFT_352025 [Glonium stellatum]|uniref:Uncharacterized protein n=1 Tax=Glonium stellatum TaxID=574774 RepID=A0A8E2FB47_9PEZI|nr:hypothetical protein AOQ84DRAFT_352025 [Glonium stellatum]
MTSAELPIDREDEEDDLTGLDPQARGKGPRHVAAGPPLHYEPSLEDINEARRREQQEDEFHAHPSEPDHLQDRDHHETHGHHGQDELNDSDSERSYISDDELDPLPDGDAPGYGTVDNLALARYQGEERARLEAEQRANVERIREQARQAREQDSEDEAHPPR